MAIAPAQNAVVTVKDVDNPDAPIENPYLGTSCTENEDGSVTVTNSGYFTQTTFTKFSEGESAKMTISVDEIDGDWYGAGVTIVVNSQLAADLDDGVWQMSGANGVFTLSFQKNGNEMEGMIYRYGAGSGSTSGAGWATASLDGDITIEVKSDGTHTALYLNGEKWDAGYDYMDGFAIPDGYLAIAPAQNAKVTIKDVIRNDPDESDPTTPGGSDPTTPGGSDPTTPGGNGSTGNGGSTGDSGSTDDNGTAGNDSPATGEESALFVLCLVLFSGSLLLLARRRICKQK